MNRTCFDHRSQNILWRNKITRNVQKKKKKKNNTNTPHIPTSYSVNVIIKRNDSNANANDRTSALAGNGRTDSV